MTYSPSGHGGSGFREPDNFKPHEYGKPEEPVKRVGQTARELLDENPEYRDHPIISMALSAALAALTSENRTADLNRLRDALNEYMKPFLEARANKPAV